MTAPADPTLAALLLAAAREPWAGWYPVTRLVLADWLEEHGDARAAAVRGLAPITQDEVWRRVDFILSLGGARPAAQHAHIQAVDWLRLSRRRELLAMFPDVAVPCPDCIIGRTDIPPPESIELACSRCRGTGLVPASELLPG